MALPSLDPGRHRLEARAELVFAVRGRKTRLTRSFAEPPLQVQRVLYLDEDVPDMAFLFLLNPTPGLFQGDSQTTFINAGPRTRVHLMTPSATKIYAMPEGDARQTMEFALEEGSYLEYLPGPLIPFRDARLSQRTRVKMASGATLVAGEVVLPGRVASGEDFAFHSLDRRLTVVGSSGRPLFHEASLLTPQTLKPLGRGLLTADLPVTGTLVIISPGQELGALGERLRRSLSAEVEDGRRSKAALSELPDGVGLVVRALTKDSQTIKTIFRKSVEMVRHYFV